MDDARSEGAALGERLAGVNKAQFARDHKIPGGASMISQNISGNRPISLEAGIAYAQALGCTLGEISPRLSAIVAAAQAVQQPSASSHRPTLQEALSTLAEACQRATPTTRQNVLDVLSLIIKDPEANAGDLLPVVVKKLSGERMPKTGTHD